MSAEPGHRRRHRAAVVVQLAALRKNTELSEDPRWQGLTWCSLNELPDWCAFNKASRRSRLHVAGAVALLPAIRRCLQGKVLLELQRLLGAERLDFLRRRPYRTMVSDVELANDSELEQQLLVYGIHTVVTDVVDPIARGLLFEVLTDEVKRSNPGGGNTSDSPVASHWIIKDIDSRAGQIAAELHGSVTGEFNALPTASNLADAAVRTNRSRLSS